MFLLRVKRAGTGATDFVGRQNYGGKNMEANKVKFLCEKYAKEVIPDSRKSFADRLAEAPDAAFEPLVNVKLKSQTAALLLSIFLGGWSAGKFYVGEIKAAVIKLVVTFILGFAGGLLSLLWMPLYFLGVIPISQKLFSINEQFRGKLRNAPVG